MRQRRWIYKLNTQEQAEAMVKALSECQEKANVFINIAPIVKKNDKYIVVMG